MMASPKFSTNTFKYFDQASEHAFDRDWFQSNKSLYQESVREPFEYLLGQIKAKHKSSLPKMVIEQRKITRPLRPSNRAEESGAVKNFSFATLCEKNRSRFEWNPAIHMQFGAKKDDNLIGVGIYMISSRQMVRLRHGLSEDFETIDKVLSNRKLKKTWGSLAGEKYKRFPKAYSQEDPAAKYLWHKQFYLHRQFHRADVKSKVFIDNLVNEIGLVLPFLQWTRKTVGVYR